MLDSKSINKSAYESPARKKKNRDDSIDDIDPDVKLGSPNKTVSPDKRAAFKIKPASINFSGSPMKLGASH